MALIRKFWLTDEIYQLDNEHYTLVHDPVKGRDAHVVKTFTNEEEAEQYIADLIRDYIHLGFIVEVHDGN